MADCEQKNDEELVSLAIVDPDAFGCLADRYAEKLIRYIRRISGVTREDAEDILQEAMIKTYLNINDFDSKLKFSSWIYRIVRNEAISQHRKRLARPKTVTDEDDNLLLLISSDEDIAKNLERKCTGKEIRELVDKLDEKYREVLILKFIEQKDYQEISDIIERPMGTVATFISRAKKQFRELYIKSQSL